jgi:hypothetical protein
VTYSTTSTEAGPLEKSNGDLCRILSNLFLLKWCSSAFCDNSILYGLVEEFGTSCAVGVQSFPAVLLVSLFKTLSRYPNEGKLRDDGLWRLCDWSVGVTSTLGGWRLWYDMTSTFGNGILYLTSWLISGNVWLPFTSPAFLPPPAV